MSLKSNFELMSRYNQWMNQKIYRAAHNLSIEEIKENKGAFFRSILGTLNHILVADIIWLKRFTAYPKKYRSLSSLTEIPYPKSLDTILYDDLDLLFEFRQKLDLIIIDWCQEITDRDLNDFLKYQNMKGQEYLKNFGQLIQHFFNHQTHHRGQLSTLLNQSNIDIGVTDLLKILPNE